MRYKEISLNGLGKVTARDIVNELIDKVELLYNNDYDVLCRYIPEVDIEINYNNKNGYMKFEIDLIIDRNVKPFLCHILKTRNMDYITCNELEQYYDKIEKNVNKLFYTGLQKLNKLYKNRAYI